MSFQAYIDNVQAKTGKTPADFRLLAKEKGLVKTGEIVAWLKADFALGHGHANAIARTITQHGQERVSEEDAIAAYFTGKKAVWRASYDDLLTTMATFGEDVEVAPTKSYLSLVRGGKKFGIVQVSGDRLDIGIKRKDAEPTERFEAAGSWNAMVTHRVRISTPEEIDTDVFAWLKQAYDAA